MTIYDKILLESTLFELYDSSSFKATKMALDIALQRITQRIEKTKGEWTKNKLESIKKAIQDEISGAYANTFDDVKKESVSVAEVAYNAMLLDISTSTIPTKVIDDLTSSNREILGYSFKELFQLQSDNHSRQLKVILANGVAQGMTSQQIIRDIGIKSDTLTKGQLNTNIYTTITDSREKGRYSSYQKLESMGVIKGYEFTAVLDFRTSSICQSLDGKKYYTEINDVPNKPVLHFNCRSKLVPITKQQNKSSKRASMFGEVSSDMNYSQWFDSIDDKIKQKFMSQAKYKAYKSGIYKINSVADIQGKKLDLSQIKDILIK